MTVVRFGRCGCSVRKTRHRCAEKGADDLLAGAHDSVTAGGTADAVAGYATDACPFGKLATPAIQHPVRQPRDASVSSPVWAPDAAEAGGPNFRRAHPTQAGRVPVQAGRDQWQLGQAGARVALVKS